MDLAVESDIYAPLLNENGEYIDHLPPSSYFKNGMRCPCGSRKEHVFDNRHSFSSHTKTKTHQKWLAELNVNKQNHFIEKIKLNETVSTQKIIIANLQSGYDNLQNKYNILQTKYDNLQKTNNDHIRIIAHLTKLEIKDNSTVSVDLLNFD